MRHLLVCIFLLSAVSVYADQSGEKPIAENEKIRISQTLKKAVLEKSITQRQYDETMIWLNSTPCNGVDRSLNESRKKELASVIAKQERLESVDVIQLFEADGWTIVYVNTHVSDEPYLFYSGDPVTAKRAVTAWSGAAFIFETSEIKEWVLKNAPGISTKLASCFAWHVTLNRD